MTQKQKELIDFLRDGYESFSYNELEDKYAEFLDEIYEPVELAGMTIYASDMQTIDPIMFRCGVSDWHYDYYDEIEGEYYAKEDIELAESELEEHLAELEDEEEVEE